MNIPLTIATASVFGTIAAMYAPLVKAHESHGGMIYDAACCSGSTGGEPSATRGDCQQIPASSVKAIGDGNIRIVLNPGDHHMVTRQQTFVIKQSETRRSTDGEWHVCLFPFEDVLRCTYMPDMGF